MSVTTSTIGSSGSVIAGISGATVSVTTSTIGSSGSVIAGTSGTTVSVTTSTIGSQRLGDRRDERDDRVGDHVDDRLAAAR